MRAQVAAEEAVRRATEFGIHKLDIVISGTGAGRETAVRTLQNMGMDVGTIKDITPTLTMVVDQRKKKRIMARYTGPRVRVSRRLGFNVFENKKGDKALQDRPYPPGENGRKRMRETDYGTQLKEKQKLDTCMALWKSSLEITIKKPLEWQELLVKITYIT